MLRRDDWGIDVLRKRDDVGVSPDAVGSALRDERREGVDDVSHANLEQPSRSSTLARLGRERVFNACEMSEFHSSEQTRHFRWRDDIRMIRVKDETGEQTAVVP